ncbi:sodium:solute symporter family protein [Flintibacter muris]|uniref:sodium:solute symporter family protein n=1 Tax=Flintibacter muris TaxID=2941327 RepID=UPI00203D61F0|nr:sodium:solute symporter family protein [Flintibacter muris]
MSKTMLYLGYFCLYSVVLLIIGKSSLRDESTPEDYFICERKVGTPQSVCTFTGTWVSAITILSLTGSVYEDGLAVLFYSVIPWFLGAFLLALVARRLYSNGIITIPELFRVKYGSRVLQAIYAVIIIGVYVFYLVSQYKGFGMISAALFDIPYPVGVGMVYLFILYTTFGGYRSVVRTDVFNLILLVVGLAVLMVSILSQVGGFGALYGQAVRMTGYSAAGMSVQSDPLLAPFGGRYTPLVSLSMFWGWGLGLAANPQYLVRMLGASSSRDARRTVLYSLVLLFAIYFALIHIGLGMRVLVPELSRPVDTDGIIIQLINNELYGPWSGFFLFAVFGACISTANSQLLLIASSFSYDLAKGLAHKELSASRVVNLGRLAVLGGGTLAMLLTLNPPPFTLSYGGDVWGILGILLFPPLYGTLLSRRITRRGVWACLIAGGLAIAVLYPLFYRGIFTAHPAMFAMPLSTAAMIGVSLWDGKECARDEVEDQLHH